MTHGDGEHQSIQHLVRDLGAHGREATIDEAIQIRHHFAKRVLPGDVNVRVARKYSTHVEDNLEWPGDSTPEDYLESLHQVALSERTGIYLEYSDEEQDWTVYLVGRAQR